MATLPNPRRERFAQLIALGLRSVDAGREIGVPHTTWQHWVYHPQVIERVNEFKAMSARKVSMSRTRKLERLGEIIESEIREPVTAREVIAAISEHNEMTGEHEFHPAFQDNRQYNIIVATERGKDLVKRLMNGEKRQERVMEGQADD